MGDKGTQQFIPGVVPSAPMLITPIEPSSKFNGIIEVSQGERKKTSKSAAAKKKKRKNAKKSRKNNR